MLHLSRLRPGSHRPPAETKTPKGESAQGNRLGICAVHERAAFHSARHPPLYRGIIMASSSATRCRIRIRAALPRVAVENRRQLGRTITYCSSRPRCRCCGQRLGILARRHPTFCEIRCTSTCLTPCLSCRLCKNEANFLWQQTLCPNHCERACPPRRNSLDLARRIASIRV